MTKEARTYNGLKIVYLINGVGKTGQICAEMKLDHFLTSCIEINSKCIKALSNTQYHKNSKRKHRQ